MLSFKFFTLYGVAMLAGLLLGPILAAWKNRDNQFWGFVGFLFPPALVLLLALPQAKGPKVSRGSWDEQDAREYHHQYPEG